MPKGSETVENVIGKMSTGDKVLFFRTLRLEVVRSYGALDFQDKQRWASSAKQLVEILQHFEREPSDATGCSMSKAGRLSGKYPPSITADRIKMDRGAIAIFIPTPFFQTNSIAGSPRQTLR